MNAELLVLLLIVLFIPFCLMVNIFSYGFYEGIRTFLGIRDNKKLEILKGISKMF